MLPARMAVVSTALALMFSLSVRPAAAQEAGRQGRQPAVAPPTTIEAPDADRTRQQLRDLLEKYPPSLGRILKLDTSLLNNEAYLAPYPALASFLITIAGRIENQGMVWNEARTSVGNNWGHGPPIAEAIPCSIEMEVSGARKVYALDGTGKRAAAVDARLENGTLRFSTAPSHQTLWYEIASE